MKKLALILGGIAALVGALYAVTLFVVKPVSTDLSQLGQGKPALVLAYENFSPTGGEALEVVREIRPGYAEQLLFVVADMGVPEGQGFAKRHRLIDGQVLLLDPQGTPLATRMVPNEGAALRSWLEAQLANSPASP